MTASPPSGAASHESLREIVRARLTADAVGELLQRIDFRQLQEAHLPHVVGLCAEHLAEAAGPAVLRQLGLSDAQPLAEELGEELVALRGFYALLQDPEVSDILVNGSAAVYVERDGRLQEIDFVFPSERMLYRTALWMTARVGRPVSDRRPMVDARLPDGSRLNVIVPPLAVDGTVLSIRRFRHLGLDLDGLARAGALPPEALPLLRAMVAGRLNLLVSGGTGAGKTTFLNALSEAIDPRERLITVEDSAELRLRRPHVVRLETRVADAAGEGEVPMRALVRNALRMRPDRIVVGEVRGPEALDMLQAMNTGHEGSMSTVHANSPRDALDRLETMVAMGDVGLDERAVRGQIARSIDAVLHLRRLPDGRRALDRLSEVGRLQGEVITMQDILVLHTEGSEPGGRARGVFASTGVRPSFTDRLERAGFRLDPGLWRIHRPLP